MQLASRYPGIGGTYAAAMEVSEANAPPISNSPGLGGGMLATQHELCGPGSQRAHSFATPAGTLAPDLLSTTVAQDKRLVPSLSFSSNYALDHAIRGSPRGASDTGTATTSRSLGSQNSSASVSSLGYEPTLNVLDGQDPPALAAISEPGGKASSQGKLLMRKTLAMSVTTAAVSAVAKSFGTKAPASVRPLLAPSLPLADPSQQLQEPGPEGKRFLGRSWSIATPGVSLRPPPSQQPQLITQSAYAAAFAAAGAATPGPRPSSAGGQAEGPALAHPGSATQVRFTTQSTIPEAGPQPEQPATGIGSTSAPGQGAGGPAQRSTGGGGVAGPTGTGERLPARQRHSASSVPAARPWQQQQQQQQQPQQQRNAASAAASAPLLRLHEAGFFPASVSQPSVPSPTPAAAPPAPPVPSAGGAATLPQSPSRKQPVRSQRPASAQRRRTADAATGAAAAADAASAARRGALRHSFSPPSPSSPTRLPGAAGAPSSDSPGVELRIPVHGDDASEEEGDGEGEEGAEEEEDAKLAVVVPEPPEVRLRTPRWLNLSAFQVTEQLRSGRLQELVDRLASISCPTLLDLCGLEFSGSIGPPGTGSARGPLDPGALLPSGGMFRHTTMRFGPGGLEGADDGASARSYRRGGAVRAGVRQVLAVPPGQHVTLCNGTLLLTAEQYLLVGRRASLVLKDLEILGCCREAAFATAAMRRRMFTAAPPPGHAPMHQLPAGAAAAAAAQQHTWAGGATSGGGAALQPARRVSTTGSARDADRSPPRHPLRRVSDASGAVPEFGFGGLTSPSAPNFPRRMSAGTAGIVSSSYPALSGPAPSQIQIPGAARIQALVDPNEYVDEHGLLEVQGGHVRISNCRLWPGRCQLALCVSERGVCSLSSSDAGPVCAAGAKSVMLCQHTALDGGAAGGVSVLYGAQAALTGCRLRFGQDASDAAACGGGGGGEVGVEARGADSVAVLSDCELLRCAVGAYGGAHVHMRGAHLSYARGHGLLASDAGTAVYGRNVRVEDSGRGGAAAVDGASLTLADSTITGNRGPGVTVLQQVPPQPEWQVRAGIPAPPPSPPPGPRATAALLRCSVSANAGHGANVSEAALLQVVDSELFNNLGSGVAVEGAAAELAADGMRVIRNEAYGVRVAGGGGAALARCCVRVNGRDGVAVEGRNSQAQLTGCESAQNRESGLCVTDAASVALRRCRLSANQHDGLAVGGAGSLATAAGCTLGGNVAKGAVVCMGGHAELRECALHCNGSRSAQVADEGSRLVLRRGCSLDRPPVAIKSGVLLCFVEDEEE